MVNKVKGTDASQENVLSVKVAALITLLKIRAMEIPNEDARRHLLTELDRLEKEIKKPSVDWRTVIAGFFLDIDEEEWMRMASLNDAFDFLSSPEEDIYSLDDGAPFNG